MTTTKITSKGQVTLPKRVRDAMGLKPGQPVEVEYSGGKAIVSLAGKARKSDARRRLEGVIGTIDLGMTTDEYMKLMRGQD
jgi:AbrB family looped-hinge helix DNA binding protein